MTNPRITDLIKGINLEISGKKRREDCVAGDKVVFVGGYFKNTARNINRSSPTNAFTVGKEYTLRGDYYQIGYANSYDIDKNPVKGTFNFEMDDAGSRNNGWAAALFEPV